MALVSINEQYLENISDAIRAKNGFSTQYRPKDMASAIAKLSTVEGGSSTYNIIQGITEIPNNFFYFGDETDEFETCLLKLSSLSATNNTTLTTIGYYAFAGQNLLVEFVDIPSSLNKIGNYAFAETGLQTIDLSNTSIQTFFITVDSEGDDGLGGGQFYSCKNLSSVFLPPQLKHVGDGTFHCCESLGSISLPQSLITIGANAFQRTALTSIVIPSGVEKIYGGAFASCPLRTVNFLGVPESIANDAFYNCPGITDIYIPCSESDCPAGAPWGATDATIHYNS